MDAFLEAVEEWPAVTWKRTRSWSLGLPGPLGRVWGGAGTRREWGCPASLQLSVCVWVFSAASSVHTPRTPPASRVIKTRYRIVKKSPVCPLSNAPAPVPSWRTRRPSLSR